MSVKRFVPLLLVVLLLVGVGVYVLVVREKHAADPLHYLPADTIALIDLQQPADLYEKYRQSRLGRRMSVIRWDDLLRQFGASEEQAGSFREQVAQVQSFLAGPLFRELFARRAVLAQLPVTASSTGSDVAADPWRSMVLIVHPRHRTDVTELLAPLLQGANPPARQTHLGRDIRIFLLGESLPLAVVASEGLLLASFSVDTLKRCLDLALGQSQGIRAQLDSNAEYSVLRKRADGRDEQFVYGDVQAMIRLLDGVVRSEAGTEGPSGAPDGGRFGHGALFCGAEGKRLDCTTVLRVAPGSEVAETAPAVDDLLAAAPAELLLHFWTNLLDPAGIASGILHYPQVADTVAGAEEWLVRKTGYSLPAFFSIFGNQISLTVTGMRGNGFFPLPLLYGRLAVKDEQRLRQALAAVVAGKTQTSRETAGVSTHTLVLAGGLLQPSWAIRDDFLFFADSPEQLEQGLLQPAAPLAESQEFRQANVGLQEPSNMTAYVNYPRLMDGLQQLVSWGATILAMMDQERGGRARVLVDLAVTPILDGMKMFALGSSRLRYTSSELVLESALILAEQPEKVE